MNCWGISSGTAGMTSQVRALASALNAKLDLKTILISKPWDILPNIAYATSLGGLIFKRFIAPGVDVNPPYPDVVISCGRRASMAALGLKNAIKNDKTKFIHIHDPCVPLSCFDLVVTVDHDKLSGPNIIKTHFALHHITEEVLAEAKRRFAPRFAAYSTPYVAVLLGGSTNQYQLTLEGMSQMVMALQRVLAMTSGSLLITPSRRTGEANVDMLRQVFAGNPRVYIYDLVEDNPYIGMLALADTIIATNDSVNMMSEAAATGKPLYILPLPGHSGTKQARFADTLINDGIARPLGAKLEHWHYEVGHEMQELAAEVKRRLHL